jgi:hypothetical protein
MTGKLAKMASLSACDKTLKRHESCLIFLSTTSRCKSLLVQPSPWYSLIMARYGQQNTIDSFIRCYVNDLILATEDLLKRTDIEEIHVNQIARERLPSLLQAIRLLRSCITAISKEKKAATTNARRTTAPRPDSLDPSLGDSRRSGRLSPLSESTTLVSPTKGIGTWLAGIPRLEDAQPLRHSRIIEISKPRTSRRSKSKSSLREENSPTRATFLTDDAASSNYTLVAPELRLKKTRSWSSGITAQYATHSSSATKVPSKYTPSIASSNVSVIHKKITCDKIAVAKSNRKNLDVSSRVGVDRILANIPSEATPAEVERVLWEGANPMVAHPEFGFFFLRAAFEMSPGVLRVLVEFGADITKSAHSPNQYHCAMHAATLGGQLDTMKYLASLGHSIHDENEAGETPLILAVKTSGAYKVAKYLLDKGADVNHETEHGETPLYLALTSKVLEGRERSRMIELLMGCGAEGNVSKKESADRGDAKGRSILGIT